MITYRIVFQYFLGKFRAVLDKICNPTFRDNGGKNFMNPWTEARRVPTNTIRILFRMSEYCDLMNVIPSRASLQFATFNRFSWKLEPLTLSNQFRVCWLSLGDFGEFETEFVWAHFSLFKIFECTKEQGDSRRKVRRDSRQIVFCVHSVKVYFLGSVLRH